MVLFLVITEDINMDTQAGDATFKDDLMLLAAGPDGAQWAEELAKLLQAEQKERDETTRCWNIVSQGYIRQLSLVRLSRSRQ